ncbi:histone-lysine N-methyltransferase SETD2 [Sporothrix brasiliensis 5110]|uniref:Histone-lysine N-methyltransferase, H3 lysine-36 specific n=1 Tax=Sporothrix brasiliensis 5110 TaxID=1398154 RepID=A0A0C2FB69_9PEZI|nr:histone-lysine N-methyltransferase SETD2 [Sporothrix brasiliensis 5110]KIH88318.1 histone-lysine N-methyltransferase SETD2 [Sporothrix brasiliensis 5110]
MDDDVRIPHASRGPAANMTTAGTRTNGTRAQNGVRVAVKSEASPFQGSATPNGSKGQSVSRSRSPDDDVQPSPSDVSTPDMSAAASRPNRKSSAKASRSATPSSRPNRMLFDQLPDATAEATSKFQVIEDCLYGSKNMGSSDNDAFDCDCAEELHDGRNMSCGEDSDCINRATKMECVEGGCNCGDHCQNQRFQQRQYASVSVIKTEKKGFGLRTDADLHQNEFIFEYIGEVINEPTFRRRMIQYDEEGIKHFYFMSLTKSEFVDATRKGNLGRFCNHSCNPNCYVDKWVVGNKLRMGIFAGRSIRAGEELVFDYNVDRYGADPQPCYCGEPNCTGFIGGKTQTERATKLSLATIEALGIDDPDSWDTTVAKKQRRKKPNEDDEEYVSSLQQSGLAEDGVTKVMAALMQCKEKWIAVKLLARIQAARDDERVLHRVVRMHGYQILCSILTLFKDDNNVVLQVLDILYMFPRLTKNKISDSNIELAIRDLSTSEHEDVAAESKRLLEEWDKLQTAYRIPRKKFDPNAPVSAFEDRRGRDVQNNESADDTNTPRPRPVSPLHGMNIPKGPRSNIPQRNSNFFINGNSHSNNGTPRNQRKPMNNSQTATQNLPSGWFSATDPKGNVYYYNKSGATTWKRPTAPTEIVRGLTKAQQDIDAVQDIIDRLTKQAPRPSITHTPQAAKTPVQEPKSERWRSLPIEKQQKIYENTLHPHIKSVTDRYRNRLPREEIKRLGKDISKKIVASDYKNNRVDDPNTISPALAKKMKVHVHDYFERAVKKYEEHEKKKAGKADRQDDGGGKQAAAAVFSASGDAVTGSKDTEMAAVTDSSSAAAAGSKNQNKDEDLAALDDMVLSDDDGAKPATDDATTLSPETSDRKRKRADSGFVGDTGSRRENGAPIGASPNGTPSETPSIKRLKDEEANAGTLTPPTPPPPPPPPAEDEDEQLAAARRQREEEEEALRRENEDAMRDFEEQTKQNGPAGQVSPVAVSGAGGQ